MELRNESAPEKRQSDNSHELFEQHLRKLPQYTMSARGDELFYSRLNAVIHKQQAQKRAAQKEARDTEPSLFLGFRRFVFSFGLGVFGIGIAFTALSYRDSVTRGTLLYPWKQFSEAIEGSFAFDTQQQVNTELRFADRRLRESWVIIDEHDTEKTAWLINTAYAAGETVTARNTTEAKAKDLKRTLSDLHKHINNASRIVESQTLNADTAEALLDEIAVRADAQVTSLKKMKKVAPVNTLVAVQNATNIEEHYVVKVVVAREDVRSIRESRGSQAPVRLAQFSGLMLNSQAAIDLELMEPQNNFDADADTRNSLEARRALDFLDKQIKALPRTEQEKASARVNAAKQALEQGKTATAYGLSISLSQDLATKTPTIVTQPRETMTTKVVPPAVEPLNQQRPQQIMIPAQTEEQQNRSTEPIIIKPSTYDIPTPLPFTPTFESPEPSVIMTPPVNTQGSSASTATGGQQIITTPIQTTTGGGASTIITTPAR